MKRNKICQVKNKDVKIISKDSFEKYLALISGAESDSKLKVECEGSGNDDCNNENDSTVNIRGDIESKSEFRSVYECLSSEATEIPDLSGDQAQQSLTRSEILRSASDVDPLARELHRQQSTDDDLDDTPSSFLDFSKSIADGQSGIASPTASKGFKHQLFLRTPNNEVALQTTTDNPVYHDLFGYPLTEHARLPVRCLDRRTESDPATKSTPLNEPVAADGGGPVLERNLFGSEECGTGGDLSRTRAETEKRPTSRTAAASDTFHRCNKETAVQEATTTSEESGDSTTSSPASGDLLLRTKEQTSKQQQGHTQRSSISSFLCSALSLNGEDTSPQSLSSEDSNSSCSSKVAQIAAEIESRVARHSGSDQVGAGKRATKPALFPIIYSSASNCHSSYLAAGNVANEWSESSSLWRAAASENQEQHQTPPSLSDIASSSLSRTSATAARNASETEQQQVCAEQKPRHMISGQSTGGRGGAARETVSRRTTLLLFIMTSLLLGVVLLARVYGLSHFAVALERREAAIQALRHHLLPAQKPRHGRVTATSDTGSPDKLDDADVFIQLSDTSVADKSHSSARDDSDNTSNVVDQLEQCASHAAVEASEIAEKYAAASAVVSTAAAERTSNKQNGVVVVRSMSGVWRRLLARLRRAQQVTARVLQAPFRLLWRLGRETAVSKEPSR